MTTLVPTVQTAQARCLAEDAFRCLDNWDLIMTQVRPFVRARFHQLTGVEFGARWTRIANDIRNANRQYNLGTGGASPLRT